MTELKPETKFSVNQNKVKIAVNKDLYAADFEGIEDFYSKKVSGGNRE